MFPCFHMSAQCCQMPFSAGHMSKALLTAQVFPPLPREYWVGAAQGVVGRLAVACWHGQAQACMVEREGS